MNTITVFFILSIFVLASGHRHWHRHRHNQCPVKQDFTPGCRVKPYRPKPGQVSGIGAFQYIEGRPNAPSQWGRLNCRTGRFRQFRNCEYCKDVQCGGKFQSPINVKTNRLVFNPFRKAPRVFLSPFAKLKYEITAANFELKCEGEGSCGTTRFKNKRFVFDQVHVHHFSEHWLNGRRFPLEMHMVHKAGNDLLVLAIFFRPGRYNHQLQKFMNIGARQCKGFMNLRALTRFQFRTRNIVGYTGSTTTPPCSEGRNWVISTRPLTASRRQINMFLRLMGNINEARPLQPLNGRKIFAYK